jgi:DNA-binding NarL/FixJ family response regulator
MVASKPPARILIVEDDRSTRDHLASAIRGDASLALAGSAASLAEARPYLAARDLDVLVTDLGLPDGSGISLIREVRTAQPQLPVMVLTVFGDERTVLSAIAAGAASYLVKGSAREEIVESIQQLLQGGAPISPSIARHLLRRLQTAPEGPAAAPGGTLTARETEVLRHVAKGFRAAEVAGLLGISVSTVTTHVRSLYRKLEVNSRTSAIYEAVNLGLIRLDD